MKLANSLANRPKDHFIDGDRLLVLGGSEFQVRAIKEAVRLGCEVICCDNKPSNPGHRIAHKSYNISTVEHEAVLELGKKERIDGVLAYASDPAAPTAAYIAEQLNLPGSKVESVSILTNKPRFRQFLLDQGFCVPSFETVATLEQARDASTRINFPLMIKPVDSSGSKGVFCIYTSAQLIDRFSQSLQYSSSGKVILEQYIPRQDSQIAGDGLVLDGEVVFFGFGNEHFDEHCNPCAPVGESFPGTLSKMRKKILLNELQRLFGLLGIRDLVFNLDAFFGRDGSLYILDLGPRAGGNLIPQVLQYHTGCDLTNIAIRIALGMSILPSDYEAKPRGFFATCVIHSRRDGVFERLEISSKTEAHLIELELWVSPGDDVRRFQSSRDSLGCAIFSFSSDTQMKSFLLQMNDLLAPVLRIKGT